MKELLVILLFLSYVNMENIASESKKIDALPNNKLIDRKIEKGLNYLYENQLPNGEFPTDVSLSPDMSNNSNVTTFFGNVSIIFDTGLILHTLNIADKKNKKIIEMKNKAIIPLLNNMKEHNVWNFFGKNHYNPPDTDDTSVLFAALVESRVDINDESLDYMLNYKTPNGAFYIWMNSEEWFDPTNPLYNISKFRLNEIDHNVNANVLYAYSLRKRTQYDIIKYLKGVIKNESFKNGSTYYPSPYVFTYLVSKIYFDGKVKELKPHLNKLKEYILETQNIDGGWGNDLDTALATNALINMNYKGDKLKRAIEHILYTQKNNGSWDTYSIYILPETPIYFGSEELTTSFNLEALIKYKKYFLRK